MGPDTGRCRGERSALRESDSPLSCAKLGLIYPHFGIDLALTRGQSKINFVPICDRIFHEIRANFFDLLIKASRGKPLNPFDL